MVRSVAFMFEVHQPRRLRPYGSKSIADRLAWGPDGAYDGALDGEVFRRVADKCYGPATEILLSAASSGFRFSFSAGGIWMEQAKRYCPRPLELLRRAVDLGAEPVAQPYYHSVAPLMSDLTELSDQVGMHREAVEAELGQRPSAAEATEMIYNNDIGAVLGRLGFSTALTEGADRALAWRSPNFVYASYGGGPRLLLRNYRLSDDLAFRFSDASWDQYPLTADKYADWISAAPGDLVFVAVDYETFGEHQWKGTGILEFLAGLPQALEGRGVKALTVSEAASSTPPVDVYDIPPWRTISWADVEKDASAWTGSEFQAKAISIYEELGAYARAVGGDLLAHWRYIGVSDNFYYMSSKAGPSGEVHLYFSPYKRPLDAYTVFMSALLPLQLDVLRAYVSSVDDAAWRLRVPRALAFRARPQGGQPGVEVRSLAELLAAMESSPSAFAHHISMGDVQAWIRDVILWGDLADGIDRAIQGASDPVGAAASVLRAAKAGRGSLK